MGASSIPTVFELAGALRRIHHAHARRRARERFGLDANAVARIEDAIRDGPPAGRIELFRGRIDHHAVYAVRLDQRWYPVVFDTFTASVVSFPPMRMLFKYKHEIEEKGRAPC
jgi:hypothetical protein